MDHSSRDTKQRGARQPAEESREDVLKSPKQFCSLISSAEFEQEGRLVTQEELFLLGQASVRLKLDNNRTRGELRGKYFTFQAVTWLFFWPKKLRSFFLRDFFCVGDWCVSFFGARDRPE